VFSTVPLLLVLFGVLQVGLLPWQTELVDVVDHPGGPACAGPEGNPIVASPALPRATAPTLATPPRMAATFFTFTFRMSPHFFIWLPNAGYVQLLVGGSWLPFETFAGRRLATRRGSYVVAPARCRAATVYEASIICFQLRQTSMSRNP
jgi:hypothetical protein